MTSASGSPPTPPPAPKPAAQTGCTKWSTTGWHQGTYLKAFERTQSPNGQEWTWQQCAEACANHKGCEFFTLQLSGNKQCLMMSQKGHYMGGSGHAEGPPCKGSGSPPAPPPAPKP